MPHCRFARRSLAAPPALCAVLLKPHHAHAEPRGINRILRGTFGRFNAGFEWLSSRYSKMTSRFVRASALILVVYVGLISLTGFQFARMPSGFIPDQDVGYQAIVVMLPPGSSLERTDAVVRKVNDIVLKTPGVEHTSPTSGYDVTTATVAPKRFQLSGAHLSGTRPGGRGFPEDAAGHRATQGPQCQRGDGSDRHGGDL
jgi:multidrug efflux pump subunit AcrB